MAVNATAIWRARPSGSNTNGGGYDPGIAGAATDYSRQNAAQATGTVGTASGTTAFTDAGGAFTSAMIGNALWIASGAGFTVGAYFITAFTSSTAVTLDRSPGTGSAAHWALGGGWADFWTNTTSSGPLVTGNIVYILGSGTPNPASYTPDYNPTASWTPVAADANGHVTFANDPSTPGYKAWPDTTGGMPLIKDSYSGFWANSAGIAYQGIWVYADTVAMHTGDTMFRDIGGPTTALLGCVFDEVGLEINITNGSDMALVGCEAFSSVGGAPSSIVAFQIVNNCLVDSCNFHDLVNFYTINTAGGCVIVNSIIAKNAGIGVRCGAANFIWTVKNCTIDANGGSGILLTASAEIQGAFISNNIISNHTTGGTFGIEVTSGSATVNNATKLFVDYNTFYNNTTDLSNLSYGPHDTHGGSNPYVGQSTENYTLA